MQRDAPQADTPVRRYAVGRPVLLWGSWQTAHELYTEQTLSWRYIYNTFLLYFMKVLLFSVTAN